MTNLVNRLNNEADLCRNAGPDDIAALLDEAAKTIAAQDGLVEALQAIHFYVDASDLELKEEGMSRTDALVYARKRRKAALASLGDKP